MLASSNAKIATFGSSSTTTRLPGGRTAWHEFTTTPAQAISLVDRQYSRAISAMLRLALCEVRHAVNRIFPISFRKSPWRMQRISTFRSFRTTRFAHRVNDSTEESHDQGSWLRFCHTPTKHIGWMHSASPRARRPAQIRETRGALATRLNVSCRMILAAALSSPLTRGEIRRSN